MIAEHVVVDDRHQAVKLGERVLERGCGQEQLVGVGRRIGDLAGDLVAALVDVSQAVRLVDDDHVPWDGCKELGLGRREVIRADENGLSHAERVRIPLVSLLAEGGEFENPAGKEELLLELLLPLLAKRRRNHEQEAPPPLRPALRQDDAGLDGLAEPHLVGEDGPLRERGSQCE
ncbi:hypothetical protein D3C86_1631890 [compost metagenome]